MTPRLILVGQGAEMRATAELAADILGIEHSACLTAEEALRRAEEPGAIILTELELPGQSGAELVVEARSLGVPIAVVTTSGAVGVVLDAIVGLASIAPKHPQVAMLVRSGAEIDEALEALDRNDDSQPLLVRWLTLTAEPLLWLSALEARLGRESLERPALEAALTLDAFSTLDKLASEGRDFQVRSRAIFAIAERFVLDAALPVLMPLLDDSSALISGAAADAILVAAQRAAALRGEPRLVGQAFDATLHLLDRPDVEPLVKERALQFLAKEAPTATVGPLLSRTSASAEPHLRNVAARLLVRSDGLDVDTLRLIAENEDKPIADRLDAIDRIAREFPEELSLPILERCMPSPNEGISARAFELYFAAAESGFGPSLERAVAFGEGAQRAALLGALEHGRGAQGALVGIAKSEFLPELRVAAVRMLALRYRRGEIREALLQLADDPVTSRAANEALGRIDPHAVPPPPAVDLENDATERSAPAQFEAPPQTDDLTLSPTADELLDRAPTKPVPPASAPGPAPGATPKAKRARAPSRATVTTAFPIPEAAPIEAPSGPQPLGPIPLARAQEVLRECVAQGPGGLKGLRLMALSPRVPDEVRAGAARHLAANFTDVEVGDVLVRCLEGGPLVQSTALGCLMVKKDVAEGPIAKLAEDRSADPSARLRAVRFLPSRFGRSQVAPVLLRLLECGKPELERAALEGLFTSLRFTTVEAVELALINLLREHESLEVKTWAAQALGTFGSPAAIKHLDHFTGLFAEAEVKAVARRAVSRIKG